MSMATSTPLLSILLPTHNRADVLPYAIKSVLAQSMGDFELLITGDGCTDQTAAVVAEFMALDARIRWFDLPKAPHFGYANRNVALREARGELIGFVAHDDIISADHFALLLAAFADPQVQLVHGGSAWISVAGEVVPTVFHLQDSLMRQEFIAGRWNRIPATAFVHRRGVFAQVGYWSETLAKGGDMDLWNRIINHYGLASLQVVEDVTTFHFRASWRTQAHMDPDNEPLWKMLHQEPDRLPAALKVPPAAGETEQSAFWQHLQSSPAALTHLRQALVLALQSFAWALELLTQAQSVTTESHDFAQTVDRLGHEITKHRDRAERLRGELDRAKQTIAAQKSRQALGSFWSRLRGK
jgi:hypothetical protein